MRAHSALSGGRRNGLGARGTFTTDCYLSDIRYYGQMNRVYKTVFPGAPPARATLGSVLMSPDALVERKLI